MLVVPLLLRLGCQMYKLYSIMHITNNRVEGLCCKDVYKGVYNVNLYINVLIIILKLYYDYFLSAPEFS